MNIILIKYDNSTELLKHILKIWLEKVGGVDYYVFINDANKGQYILKSSVAEIIIRK